VSKWQPHINSVKCEARYINTVPWEKDTLNNVKVLHENISVWFGGQIADCVPNAELDGSSQSFSCGLEKMHEETGKVIIIAEIKATLISSTVTTHMGGSHRQGSCGITFRGQLQEDIYLVLLVECHNVSK